MNCERIKGLIMTDYIDGEMNAKLRRKVVAHIIACGQCKQFERILRQTAREPFEQFKPLKPPESVWEGVKAAVSSPDVNAGSFYQNLWNGLCAVFVFPKARFAAVTFALVVFVGAIFMRMSIVNKSAINRHIGEQIIFLSYLDEDTVDNFEVSASDFETSIEGYFL